MLRLLILAVVGLLPSASAREQSSGAIAAPVAQEDAGGKTTHPTLKHELKPDVRPCGLLKDTPFLAQVRLTVTTEGLTRDVSVVKGSGNTCLDAAALRAISDATYVPAEKDGQPVEAHLIEMVRLVDVDEAHQLRGVLPKQITPPRMIRSAEPDASSCKTKGVAEFKTLVGFTVSIAGTPENATVLKSSENSCFDAEALATAQQNRFIPAQQAGHPVPYQMKIEVDFNY